ncbi:MAG: hypothetical protein Q9214_003706 [Letrouitia sp. 1 TL-2023]
MAETTSYRGSELAFEKLKGRENYVKWRGRMSAALNSAKLMGFISGKELPPDNIPDIDPLNPPTFQERMFITQCKKDWKQHHADKQACLGKIHLMLADNVEKEVSETKSLYDAPGVEVWDPKDLWEFLETRYTERGWNTKWALINKLKREANIELYKNPQEYHGAGLDILRRGRELALTWEEVCTITWLNGFHTKKYELAINLIKASANETNALPDLATITQRMQEVDIEAKERQEEHVNTASRNYQNDKKKGKGKNTGKFGTGSKGSGTSSGNSKSKLSEKDNRYFYVDRNCTRGEDGGKCKTKECFQCNPSKAPGWWLENQRAIYEKNKRKSGGDTKNDSSSQPAKNISCIARITFPSPPATMSCSTTIGSPPFANKANIDLSDPETNKWLIQLLDQQLLKNQQQALCGQKDYTREIIMDTGATHHVFANRALFTELRECRVIIMTASGYNYPCMAMGSVPLDMGNNNIITLKDVLWVLDFDVNLLSTVLLARNNVSVILNKLGKPS